MHAHSVPSIHRGHAPSRGLAGARTGTSIAQSLDGRWLGVACGERVWLEDTRAGTQTELALAAGDDLAITRSRLWVARGGVIESIELASPGHATTHAIDVGPNARLVAAGAALIVRDDRGTVLVRDGGEVVPLPHTPGVLRAVGDARFVVVDRNQPAILDCTGTPTCALIAVTAPILDAACVVDRATCLLLLDRGGEQELVVMRATGSVLARIRVRNVARIHGAANAFLVALATDDGRVILYDLRERAVVSADRLGTEACEVVLSPDGQRLTGLSRAQGRPQLFERRRARP